MPDPCSKLGQRRDSTTEEATGATIKQAKEYNHKRTVKDNEPANTHVEMLKVIFAVTVEDQTTLFSVTYLGTITMSECCNQHSTP